MFLEAVLGDAGIAEKLSREAGCREKILLMLRTLTPREEKMLLLRFGFENGVQPQTLEQIGDMPVFSRTRETIRKNEAKALRKLRHPSRSGKLRQSFFTT